MKVVCPICQKEGKFAYFETPDQKGIVAMVRHIIGYETITDAMGRKRVVEKWDTHYLVQADLDKTSWFKDFKSKRDEYYKNQKSKWDKFYEDEYFREIEKEKERTD